MEVSQIELALLIVYSAAAGALLAFIYDLSVLLRGVMFGNESFRSSKICLLELPLVKCRVTTPERPPSKVANFAQKAVRNILDFLFMLSVGIAVILIAYSENSGRVRVYIPMGIAVGFFVYRIIFKKIFLRISNLLIFLSRAVIIYMYKAVALPVDYISKAFGGLKAKIKRKEEANDRKRAKKKPRRWRSILHKN